MTVSRVRGQARCIRVKVRSSCREPPCGLTLFIARQIGVFARLQCLPTVVLRLSGPVEKWLRPILPSMCGVKTLQLRRRWRRYLLSIYRYRLGRWTDRLRYCRRQGSRQLLIRRMAWIIRGIRFRWWSASRVPVLT